VLGVVIIEVVIFGAWGGYTSGGYHWRLGCLQLVPVVVILEVVIFGAWGGYT
jgi:hypothetical protein